MATERLDPARALYAAGQYREALDSARQIISLPGEPVAAASAIAASCLVHLGDPGGALELVQRARAGDAGVESRIVLDVAEGEILTDTGRVEVAIPLLETAVLTARERAAPTLSHALAVLGAAYVAGGRYVDAITISEEAAAMEEDARPHVTIAQAAVALGDLERARAAHATALEIAQTREERGNEGWAAFAGAELALRRGDHADAERGLDDAQEIAEELGMMRLVERCRALLRLARAR